MSADKTRAEDYTQVIAAAARTGRRAAGLVDLG